MQNILAIEKEIENLREKLNKEVADNLNHSNKEKYKNLLAISTKLDDVIVKYHHHKGGNQSERDFFDCRGRKV